MATPLFSRGSFAVLAVLLFNCFLSGALVLEEKFSGAVVNELKVNLPADELWAVYRSSPDYLKILASSQPNLYRNISYVSGNGGVGTIVKYTVAPGPGNNVEYWYDNITKIDDKTKTRVQQQIEGRFLNSGFPYFASEIRVIKTLKSSSIIRYSNLFKVEEGARSNVTLIVKSWEPATAVADYVNSRRSKPVVLSKEYGGELEADIQVNLPVDELWVEYRRFNFSFLLPKIMPYYYKGLFFVSGNGEVGTRINVTLQPAYGGLNYIEQNIRNDDRTRTRAIMVMIGGPLEFGLTKFINAFTLVPESKDSTNIKAFVFYKVKPESLVNTSRLQPVWDHGIAVANYTLSLRPN